MTLPPGLDEMVDGRGGLRPHWRSLLGAFATLGKGGLAEAALRVDRAFEDEGITSILPGADRLAWRCDPIPLPLLAAEFSDLAEGLAQRATLLSALLDDLYGRQSLLSDGVLPTALVYPNPGFLRACRASAGGPAWTQRMEFYAADLIRGPNGHWMVVADRTAGASGIAIARENRRVLARVMPETFRGTQIRTLRPFFDTWQDALQRLAPHRPNPSIALLTPGTGSPQWFEHMFLSRELSCALVEGGDLTVRGGMVFLKTLKGLQQVDVLLRRLDARMIDPLELDAGSLLGVPGLMDAARGRTLRITNDPGSGLVEAPALGAWLPALSLRLLGERLRLPSLPSMWLGDSRARDLVRRDPARWLIRSATDGAAPAVALATLAQADRAALLAGIEVNGWDYAASAAIAPSVAPSVGEAGMVPKPVVLRMFLVHDGHVWRVMEGGLARVIEDDDPLAGALPHQGLSKDVWVLNDERAEIVGPSMMPISPLAIRRTTGELPSRVADNLFWLGRYIERLENAARLVRATLNRLSRGHPMPRELVELECLLECLAHARLVSGEMRGTVHGTAALSESLLATAREGGTIAELFATVARMTELARDRLTGDMYATFTHALRQAHADAMRARRSLDQLAHAMVSILRFSATVAGVAAENMVRGGGWLFLDLGRRVERAQAIAAQVATALDQSPSRVESGLRLVLELCDSVITYRSRYLTVLQPAPVLDLVLADEGNPRGLAFQLEAMWHHLTNVAGHTEGGLTTEAAALLAETGVLVRRVTDAADQATEAARLPPDLREIEAGIGALSDNLTRRYFALLPAAQTVGMGGEEPSLRGAA
ncbi:MAG TPA: circularly permuted type 2 ATP-grasp protein [Acetobacteraceae bacterium]|nr:circularly permuted type 2 ATP-grasp protein [Acetobacteraceae bacterium]